MTEENARDLYWTLTQFERTLAVAEVEGNINRFGMVDRLGTQHLYPCPKNIHPDGRVMEFVLRLKAKVEREQIKAAFFWVRFEGKPGRRRVAGIQVERREEVA